MLLAILGASVSEGSYIFNPGTGTVSCVDGGVTGVQFTDTAGCIWCATVTGGGTINTTLVSCPAATRILLEDGTAFLMEDGTNILTE